MTAAGQGLEPQYPPPKGGVLPLDEPAISEIVARIVPFLKPPRHLEDVYLQLISDTFIDRVVGISPRHHVQEKFNDPRFHS